MAKRLSGSTHGHKFTDERALRDAVREQCLKEFRERFGRQWKASDERWVKTADPHAVEREARAVYGDLQKALRRATAFVKLNARRRWRQGGHAAQFLRWWVPEHIAPLTKHASMRPRTGWPALVDESRARLVALLDGKNMLGLPLLPDGSSSFLDVRDYAIVGLLGGHWPESMRRGHTVAEIIEAEGERMRPHIKRHGQRDMNPDDGIFAKRGPKYRKPPK